MDTAIIPVVQTPNFVLASSVPTASNVLIAQPTGWEFTDAEALWQEGTRRFLESRRAANTRRVYELAIKDLLAFANSGPWSITSSIVQNWVANLRKRGLSKETINARVAAVSSYYTYLINDYHIRRPDGQEAPLVVHNPAGAKSLRSKVNPYGKSRYLSATEARAVLAAINRSTVQGLRDYALFLGYFATGRRNTELRSLRWGDFEEKDGRMFYRWSGKGKENELNEMPLRVWNCIKAWLKAAGRLKTIQAGDFVFTAISTNGSRIPRVAKRTDAAGNPVPYDPTAEPISTAQVGSLLKRYCRRAGLDPVAIHPHTLRHTAAMLRKEAGDDIEKICAFLGHSNIAVTQVYVKAIEGKKDTSWSTVEALLGL